LRTLVFGWIKYYTCTVIDRGDARVTDITAVNP